MSGLILSEEMQPIGWSDVPQFSQEYGVKGATSLAIPRRWTPPFALLSVPQVNQLIDGTPLITIIGPEGVAKVVALVGADEGLIVRSSVVGESIWERGSYDSVPVTLNEHPTEPIRCVSEAAAQVLASSNGRPAGLMIQRYVRPSAQGEFGNLLRISKTRDHWEIATREAEGFTSRQRLNSQRDQAADPEMPLAARAGLSRERLFGAIGAWLNNELLLGRHQRLTCEWITDNRQFFLVQIDEEGEDLAGVNPFQLRVAPAVRPTGADGHFLKLAGPSALQEWDKLQVLEQLWEPTAIHKPTLFYVPLANLPQQAAGAAHQQLEADFRDLIGPRGIIVRTSVRAGGQKLFNLDRTECLEPGEAARWCFETAKKLKAEHGAVELAFIAHRFVAARASAWARADPHNPTVEINALWGLPDALQYCPYDIWDVHVPTGVATDYPDYKSDMLISQADGGWEYVRVKNELARSNSIGSVEAKDIALRSMQIAERLGRACHIMWFVGCNDEFGTPFNIPWYWTEAHEADRNLDRSAYRVFTVSDHASLDQFIAFDGSRLRQALALRPTDLKLMRDNGFINAVGEAACNSQVPVILSGSTLAHAYYLLRNQGCTVVTPSEKEHARVRRSTNLGKLVRDKIPDRIANRQEMQTMQKIGGNLRKGFLFGKLLEEALEVREATTASQKIEELADLFEVFRAIAKSEDISLSQIKLEADKKRRKAGGFEDGIILLQTAIAAPDHQTQILGGDREIGGVLGEQNIEDVAEIPFTFFGFMELDQPRSIHFDRLGVRLDLTMRPDRLEIRLVRASEQLSLPLA